MTDEFTMNLWVLWHMYSDRSSAHIERAYLDENRAKEDHALLLSAPGADMEWKLDAVKLFGPRPWQTHRPGSNDTQD